METKKRLLMSFKSSDDKRVSISVDNPRVDVTEVEIKNVMTNILNANIFRPNGATLVEMIDAKIVETDTVEYDLI